MLFTAKIIWISPVHGGRKSPPFIGYRPTIRFQRHVEDWLKGASDVEIMSFANSDDTSDKSEVGLKFINYSACDKFVIEGELIELLEGYRVIGVGKIAKKGLRE